MPPDETVAAAYAAVQHTARQVAGTRQVSSELETRAQLTVVRRLLGAMLPGGESEFWQLVEKELRR